MPSIQEFLYATQLHTVAAQLVDGVDFNVLADPTAGSMVLTLPDAATARKSILIKRIKNGGNYVKLVPKGTDDIDNVTTGFILAGSTEWVELIPTSTGSWARTNQRTFCFASMSITTPANFALTTGFTLFTGFDTTAFETKFRLEADPAGDQMKIVDFQGPVVDGYKVRGEFTFAYTNNQTVTAQLYDTVAGLYVGEPMTVNATGLTKVVTIDIIQTVAVVSITNIQMHLKGESAGTLVPDAGFIQYERIGG